MMFLENHRPSVLWCTAAPPNEFGEDAEGTEYTVIGPTPLRVLVVEDEFFIALHTEGMLQAMGHSVVGIAVSADEAVEMAEQHRPDVVLMDIRLIGVRDGIDAAADIKARVGTPLLFVTAHTDLATRQKAAATRPLGFLEKPLTQERLRAGLEAVSGAP
jgi:CheY-like chemotaxis protein